MLDRVKTARAIEANIPAICRNGFLILREEPDRHPSFCIRFRTTCPDTGSVRQRSISLGQDPQLVEGVRVAIELKRERQRAHRAAKADAAAYRSRIKPLEGAVMGQIHGRRRYRRAVRKAFRQYFDKEPAPSVEAFLSGLDALKLRRRRWGRPYARRLW